MERARARLPQGPRLEKGKVLTPFPILVDGDRKLVGSWTSSGPSGAAARSTRTSRASTSSTHGVLQFKYLGQNTWDRPSYDYLMKVLEVVCALP